MGKKLWIGIGVFLFLALIVGSLFYFNIIPQSGISGFSTLSLQEAELRSDNPYLDGKVWIMTVRQGGLGQTAEGSWDPQDIQSKTDDDTTTEKDFSIKIDYDDQECVYPVEDTNRNDPIYHVELDTWTYVPFVNPCTIEEAQSRGLSNLIYVAKPSGSVTCHAVYWTEKTPVGIFGRTDLRSSMEVRVEAGDRVASKQLDTEGSTQGSIGNFGYVVWQGNLDTGKSCSYTTSMPFRPAYKNGVWRLIDDQNYEKYIDKYNERLDLGLFDASAVRDWVEDVQSAEQKALISQSFGSWDNPTSFSSAVLRETIQSPNQYPVVTVYIKADTLGIYTPTPKIKLESASSNCFRTGEDGVIRVKATNVGGESGVWNFFGSCDGYFDVTQSREYGLSAGETKEITMPLSATAQNKELGTCKIFAESPAGTESIDVSVCVDPQITCNPSEKFCSTAGGKDVIKQCSSSGASSEILKECASDEYCDATGGEPECKQGSGIGGFWGSIANFFKGLFGGVWTAINNFIFPFKLWFAIALGLLSGFLGWAYSKTLIPAFNIMTKQQLSKKKWLPLVIGVLIGVGLGFLAYTYFWTIVIVLIIFGIIKIFI